MGGTSYSGSINQTSTNTQNQQLANTGEVAYNEFNKQQHDTLLEFYKTYPSAFKNPALIANTLGNVGGFTGVSVKEAAQAMKFLALYNKNTSELYTGKNPTGFTGQIWDSLKGAWHGLTRPSNIGNTLKDVYKIGNHVWDSAYNSVATSVHKYGVAGAALNGASDIAEGAGGAFIGLGKAASGIVGRAVKSNEELWDLDGLKGYEDLWKTGVNLAENVNPWNQKNAYFIAGHVLAYYESMVHKKGTLYTLGNLIPAITAIALSGGAGAAGVGAEAGATAEEISSAAAEAAASGVEGTTAGESATAAGESATAAEEGAKVAEEGASTAAKTVNGYTKIRDIVSKSPAGTVYRGLRAVNAATGSTKMNVLYQLVQAQAKQENPKLWNETYDLNVRDARGRSENLGQATMAFFEGSGGKGMIFDGGSGLIDFWAKMLGTDPIGVIGSNLSAIHSAEGLSPRIAKAISQENSSGGVIVKLLRKGIGAQTLGNLAPYFRGIGVKNGDDVWSAYSLPFVKKAVDAIAETDSPSVIQATFRATHGQPTFSIETATQLAKAKTPREVLQKLADIADGQGLALTQMPTMGMYSWLKTALRRSLIGSDDILKETPQNVLSSDYNVIRDWQERYSEKEPNVPKLTNEDPLYQYQADVGLRSRINFRTFLAGKITQSSMYFSKTLKTFETRRVILDDAAESIPALQDMARGAMVPEVVVRSMGDFLTQAIETGGTAEFANAYREVLNHLVMRHAISGLSRTEFDVLSKNLENFVKDQVYHLAGLDGGAADRFYGANSRSTLGDIESMMDMNEYDHNAAILRGQLSELRIPAPRDIINLGKTINKIVREVAPETANLHDASLSFEKVYEIASANNLTPGHATKLLSALTEVKTPLIKNEITRARSVVHEEEHLNRYQKAIDRFTSKENTIDDFPVMPMEKGMRLQKNWEILDEEATKISARVHEIKIDKNYLNNKALTKEVRDKEAILRVISKDARRGYGVALARNKDGEVIGAISYRATNSGRVVMDHANQLEISKVAGNDWDTKLSLMKSAMSSSYARHASLEVVNKDTELKLPRAFLKANPELLARNAGEEVQGEKGLVVEGKTRSNLVTAPYDREQMTSIATLAARSTRSVIPKEARETGYLEGQKIVERIFSRAKKEYEDGPSQFAATYTYLAQEKQSQEKILNDMIEAYRTKAMMKYNSLPVGELPKVTLEEQEIQSGRVEALHDAIVSHNVNISRPIDDEADIRKWAKVRGRVRNKDEDRVIKAAVAKIKEIRASNPSLRNRTQIIIDGMNHALSLTFVPLALLSGRWAIHVGVSEGVLNSLRVGGWNMLDSKVALSLMKHEKQNEVLATRMKEMGDLKSITKDLTSGFIHRDKEMVLSKGKNLLSATRIMTRNVVAGVIAGIEESMIKGWDEEKRGRFVSDLTNLISRHDGIIPMGVHGVEDLGVGAGSGQILSLDAENKFQVSETGKQSVVKAQPTRKFEPVKYTSVGYSEALNQQLQKITEDGPSSIAAKAYKRILDSGETFGLRKGSIEWYQEIQKLVADEVHDALLKLPKSEIQKFRATNYVLKDAAISAWTEEDRYLMRTLGPTADYPGRIGVTMEEAFKEAAMKDWSTRISMNVRNSISGFNGSTNIIFHPELVDIAAGEKPGITSAEMSKLVAKMKAKSPVDIPGRAFEATSWVKNGSAKDLISKVSEQGHQKILGPMVNSLVRDHLFALEYHNQMELGRELVKARQLSEDNVEVWAENQAIQRMIRFVHNPRDKTFFEQNMRVLAPFYFAQNQAWRRAFRLAGTDLGAFERYLKISLEATNYVARTTGNGQIPSTVVPGTSWLGGMFGLGFNMTGSAGSFQSMFPTGDQNGAMGVLGSVIRPAFGPIVTIPVKGVESISNDLFHQNELSDKITRTLLGNASATSGFMSEALPSAVVSSVGQILSDVVFKNHNGTVASVENEIINDMMDLEWNKLYKTIKERAALSTGWGNLTEKQQRQALVGATDTEFAKWYNNDTNQTNLYNEAHNRAIGMISLKTIVNFFSPVALSVNAQFSDQPLLDKLMAEKKADGSPKYTYYQAFDKVVAEHPGHVFDFVAHSGATAGLYPETQSAVSFVEKNYDLVKKYPYASAMLINQSSQYTSIAGQMELALNLRFRETPQEYGASAMYALGNAYYFNYLKPELLADSRYSYDGVNLNYSGYKMLDVYAKAFGTYNPDWYDTYFGTSKTDIAYKTYMDMTEMLKKDPDRIPEPQRGYFRELNGYYDQYVQNIDQAYKDGQTTTVATLKNQWYNICQALINNPQLSSVSYYVQSVLQKLPTVMN